MTAAVEAKEKRDVMTLDAHNAFLQTSLPEDKTTEERVIMKLRVILVDMLEEIALGGDGKLIKRPISQHDQ